MKLLFDQNLSPRLATLFSGSVDSSLHVQDVDLGEADDLNVWQYAKSGEFTIVTKDRDFNDLVSFFGFPPKVIWLRRGNCSTKIIIEMIAKNLPTIENFIVDKENGILSIS